MILLALLSLGVGEEPRLPAFFSDHMVLQRETRAPLWGTAAPGEELVVRVGWDAAPLSVSADEHGRFRLELETPAAGGPYTLEVQGAGGTRVLQDVLVGEVWLASGQSNMEWTLGPVMGNGVEGWQSAVARADDPQLRFFDVPNRYSLAPADDVGGLWKLATPRSAPAFSAAAYFFARRLRAELGVPVGILSAEWGGTPAESWTRAQALEAFPEFAPSLARQRALLANPEGAAALAEAAIEAYWRSGLELEDGLGGPSSAACDDSGWRTAKLPATFADHGLADFDGSVWYRRTLELPQEWAGNELVLELGAIDDCDAVWWNGEPVGGHRESGHWRTPRRYALPSALVRKGANTLAIRVLDTGGLGGFTGPREALRLLCAGAPEGARELSLAGPWRWHAGTPLARLGPLPRRNSHDQYSPALLWNGMIAPLVPFAFRGVIWYQGESNRTRAEQYQRLFAAMIQDWRERFGRGDFPFYFVQIAPFAYGGDRGEAALLRDAQRRTLTLAETGMVVTMDIGNPLDIHPTRKREVGERLAGLALCGAYGRGGVASGPLYRSMRVEDGAIRIEFDHADGLDSGGTPVRHVTIAGADRVFHPAEARVEGSTLLVWSADVPDPGAVRFGWGAADETALWNTAGLPASSFRTDDWPMSTDER